MIGVAYNEADRRDTERVRQRVYLVDGNKQQLSAIAAHAQERGLKVPAFIDSTMSAATSAKPQPRCTTDTRKLPANGLTGRNCACCTAAPAVAANGNGRRQGQRQERPPRPHRGRQGGHLVTNNDMYMRYDKAWPPGGRSPRGDRGRCSYDNEDRYGITGARRSPDGADVNLKLRAVVVNGASTTT